MSLWERFDGIVDATEVEEVKNSFTPLEAGDYEAKLEELIAGESKQGLPMLKGRFRLMNNRIVFYNVLLQNINYPDMTAKNVAKAVADISVIMGEEIKFESLGALGGLVASLADMEGKVIPEFSEKVFKIRLSYRKNDLEMKYPEVKVLNEVVISEDDGDIPF